MKLNVLLWLASDVSKIWLNFALSQAPYYSQLTKYYVACWLCYPSYLANAAPLATLVIFFIKLERASASQISTSLAL